MLKGESCLGAKHSHSTQQSNSVPLVVTVSASPPIRPFRFGDSYSHEMSLDPHSSLVRPQRLCQNIFRSDMKTLDSEIRLDFLSLHLATPPPQEP